MFTAVVFAAQAASEFGELLREYRRAAGLTQEQLAERAGLSARSISEMERGGEHVPRRDTVSLLVRGLGLSGSERGAFEELIARQRRPRRAVSITTVPVIMAARAEQPKHNLPRPLTTFVGRDHELAQLEQVLPTTALLTLTGAGGVGKTRLAQELVRAHASDYPDGCWLVELAGLDDPQLVPSAVAAAVGLRDGNTGNLTEKLADYLAHRKLLLVLDNCEHVIDACAALVGTLLIRCPKLRVVVTSREPLAIPGEVTWSVPPLALPDSVAALSADQIMASPAVRLFVERARAFNTGLDLHQSEDLSAIVRICREVDGIPLALELAASRVRVLTVGQIADRLQRDSSVLGHGVRAGLPQHQTIRATLDWSYELLCELERVLLQRLSVFAGGWTLQCAELVCSGDGIDESEVLDLLTQLVERSMVVVDARRSVARYRFLEPIRHYAREKLESAGAAAKYRARHAAIFLELALIADRDPAGPTEIASLEQLEAEHDNLRVALRWALTNRDVEAALRSTAALAHFWERRGYFQEGCAWVEQALRIGEDGPPLYRARALNALATLYWRGSHPDRAMPIAEEGLAVSRQANSAPDIAMALLNVGMSAYFVGDYELALTRLDECVPIARRAAGAPLLSLALTFLARARLWARGADDAQLGLFLEEGLSVAEAAQSRTAMGHSLLAFGDVAWRSGQGRQAIPFWRRALMVRAELGDRRGIAVAIERLAWARAAGNEFVEAAWLFGAAAAQHSAMGFQLRRDEVDEHMHFAALVRQNLGPGWHAAWAAGEAATVDEAIARGLELSSAADLDAA